MNFGALSPRERGCPRGRVRAALVALLAVASVLSQVSGQSLVCSRSPTPSSATGEVWSHATVGSSPYSPSTDCTFRIHRPVGGCVNMTLTFFSTESCCDRLTLSTADGATSWDPKFIGDQASYCSADSLVRWQTDSTVQNLGFRMSWVLTCLPGFFLSGSSCQPCPVNSFQPFRSSSSSCLPMTICTAAQFESTAGTSTRNRVCNVAAGNHFLCADAQLPTNTLGRSQSVTIWSGLPEDLYGNSRQCAATYAIPIGQQLNGECQIDVENGYDFVFAGAGPSVYPNLLQASSSSGLRFTGTQTLDFANVQGFVQLGYTTDGSVVRNFALRCRFILSTTLSCPAGQFISGSACTSCPPGTFQASTNTQSSCTPCPSGSISTSWGATSCRQCGANSVSSADRRSCVSLTCDSGQFVSGSGCQPCPAGSFKEGLNSATACSPCSAGTFQPSVGQAFCASCTLGTNFQANPGMTGCAPVTSCAHGSFLIRPATISSDNVCSRWTTCSSQQFLAQQGTSTRDAVCESITVCSPAEFEIAAPTTSTNRICRALTTCTSSQFQLVAPTVSSDRQCRTATICIANVQFESVPLTATSDRRCSTLSTCSLSEFQARAPTPTSDRLCLPINGCNVTHFQSAAATSSSDAQCTVITQCSLLRGSYNASHVTNFHRTTTGGGGDSTANCPSGQVLNRISAQAALFFSEPALTNFRADCADLNDGTAIYRWRTSLGPFGTDDGTHFVGDLCGDSGSSRVVVGARVFKTSLGMAAGIQLLCGSLPTGASRTYSNIVVGASRAMFEDIACDFGSIARGLHVSSGGILDKFGLSCGPITGVGHPITNPVFFQTTPATRTSDAVCRAVTACRNNATLEPVAQYLASRATPTSDNVCLPLTSCALIGGSETIPPTATSDRVCQCSPNCSSNMQENEVCDAACNTAACSYDDGRCSVFFAEAIARARIDLALQRSTHALSSLQHICLFPVGNLTPSASATVTTEFMQLSRLKSVACLAAMNAIDVVDFARASGAGSEGHSRVQRIVYGSTDWASSLALVADYVQQLETVESRLAQLDALSQQISFQNTMSSQMRGFASLSEETKTLLLTEFDKLGNRITGLEQFIEGPLSRLSADMTTQIASLGAMLQTYIGSSVEQLNDRLNSVQVHFDSAFSRVQSSLQDTANTQTEILMKMFEFDADLERIADSLNDTHTDLLRMSDSATRLAHHMDISAGNTSSVSANSSALTLDPADAMVRLWHAYSFNSSASSANISMFTATGIVNFIRDALLSDEDIAARVIDDSFYYTTVNDTIVPIEKTSLANLSTVVASLAARTNVDTANLFERTMRALNVTQVAPGQVLTFFCSESLLSPTDTACTLWNDAAAALYPEAVRQRRALALPLLFSAGKVAAKSIGAMVARNVARRAATSTASSLVRRASSLAFASTRSNSLLSAAKPAQLVRSVSRRLVREVRSEVRSELRDELVRTVTESFRPPAQETSTSTRAPRSIVSSLASTACTVAVNAVPVLRMGSTALSFITGQNPCGGSLSESSGTRGLNRLMRALPVPQPVRQAVAAVTSRIVTPAVRTAVNDAVAALAPVVSSVTAPAARVLGQAVNSAASVTRGAVSTAVSSAGRVAGAVTSTARRVTSSVINTGGSSLRSVARKLSRFFRRNVDLETTLTRLDELATDAATIELSLSAVDEYAALMTTNQLNVTQNDLLSVLAQPAFRSLDDKYIPLAQSNLNLSSRFVDLLRTSSLAASDWYTAAQSSLAALSQRELETFAVNRTGNCILLSNCSSTRLNPASLTRQFLRTRQALLTEMIVNALVNMTTQFAYATLSSPDLIRGLTSTSPSSAFRDVVNSVRQQALQLMSSNPTQQSSIVSYDITREAQPTAFRELEATGQMSLTIPWPRRSIYRNLRVLNEDVWAFLLPAPTMDVGVQGVSLRKGPYSVFLPQEGDQYMTFFHPDVSRQRAVSTLYNTATCSRLGEVCTTCVQERFLQVSPYGEWQLTSSSSNNRSLSQVNRIRVYFRVFYTPQISSTMSDFRMFEGDTCQQPVCFHNSASGPFVDASACASAPLPTTTSPPAFTHTNVGSCPPGFQWERLTRSCYQCAPGFFSASNGTTPCNAWRICIPELEFQSQAPTSSSDRVCAPLSTCARGAFVAQQPTATSDRVCRACPTGSFSSTLNAFMCQAWTECAGNEFSTITPTAILDRRCRSCTVCPVGSIVTSQCSALQDTVCLSSGGSQTGSMPVSCGCPASTYLRFPCTQTTSAVCEACRSCPSNSYAILPCTSVSDTICLGCRSCSTFEYQIADCSANTDRRCELLRVCRPDEYEIVPATLTSNRICAPLRVCTGGEVETIAPTMSSNRVCSLPPTLPPAQATAQMPPGRGPAPVGSNTVQDQSSSASNSPSTSSSSSSVPVIVGVVCATIVVLVVVAAVLYSKRQGATVQTAPVPWQMPPHSPAQGHPFAVPMAGWNNQYPPQQPYPVSRGPAAHVLSTGAGHPGYSYAPTQGMYSDPSPIPVMNPVYRMPRIEDVYMEMNL